MAMVHQKNGELQLERVKANGINSVPQELDNGHTNPAASVASGLEQSGGHEQSGEPAAEGEQRAGLCLHRKLLFSVGGLPYQLCGNAYARATSRRGSSISACSGSALHVWCVVCVCAASAST